MHRRTGLRKPKNYLKQWHSKDWSPRLSPRLSVGMVDEDLPFGKEGGRKSWYLSLTQDEDLLKTLGPVRGIPKKGKTLLLFEDDVVALVQHLMLADLVKVDEQGRFVNGRAWELEWLRAMDQARRKSPERQANRSRKTPSRRSTPARSRAATKALTRPGRSRK